MKVSGISGAALTSANVITALQKWDLLRQQEAQRRKDEQRAREYRQVKGEEQQQKAEPLRKYREQQRAQKDFEFFSQVAFERRHHAWTLVPQTRQLRRQRANLRAKIAKTSEVKNVKYC